MNTVICYRSHGEFQKKINELKKGNIKYYIDCKISKKYGKYYLLSFRLNNN